MSDKVILNLEDVPTRAHQQTNLMLTLPNLEPKEVTALPSNYKNMYVLIEHALFRRRARAKGFKHKEPATLAYTPQKIEWDKDGLPYIIYNKRHILLGWIMDEVDFLDVYYKASDYCDACGYPLQSTPDDYLSWGSGDIEAEMHICPNCREENRRKT